MRNLMRMEVLVVTICAAVVLISAVRVSAIPCNGKTPTLGNCGMEDVCEGRLTDTLCTTTFGHYHEQMGGIGCQNGAINTYCAEDQGQPPGAFMKCTCEFFCTWNDMNMSCEKGMAHTLSGGQQICSLQREYKSQSCEVPP